MNTTPKKLSVFIDCSGFGCDLTYFKSEINIVDFLLDREAADVHVLITSQVVGSGGHQYQMIFYGQHRYLYYTDTLVFTTPPSATKDERRKAQVRYLELGLTPLIVKTPFANNISISVNADSAALKSAQQTKDKWNYWVFRTELNGQLNYDKVYKNDQFNGNISANRTTNKLKLDFNAYGGFAKSVYEYEDTAGMSKVIVKNTDYGFYHNLVKTVSKHVSYGYQVKLSNKTFSNLKRHFYFNPAIEYNLFKYKEVNNRFFVLRYGVDITNNRYYDTTIYDKERETLYGQIFSAAITLNQKWGIFNAGFYYHNYFKDFKLNHFSAEVNLEARVTGALSVNMYTNGSLIHDQINLVKGDASAQDVLTRRRQLGSTFNLYTSFGISYRFGSKLNNFVNPRFQGYGGF